MPTTSDNELMLSGGLVSLGGEALPTVTTAQLIFPNAPAGTRVVLLTLRSNGLTIRLDGGTPTASGNGLDYPANTTTKPYEFHMNAAEARLVKGIQTAVATTGWVEYLGRE